MAERPDNPQLTDAPIEAIVDGLVRSGREVEDLTATLGRVMWERERLMFAAWTRGLNVRLIARLAKSSRMAAQQVAERHAEEPKNRRQDRHLSTVVEQAAKERGLFDQDGPFNRDSASFGATLREARIRLGMSIEEIARLVGIDRAIYARIETGNTRPRWLTTVKLANALGVSLDDLADSGR